jgi:hypothetical protein
MFLSRFHFHFPDILDSVWTPNSFPARKDCRDDAKGVFAAFIQFFFHRVLREDLRQRKGVTVYLSFAKSLCPKLKGVLPVWRKLFGLGLQADSSTGERCWLRRHEPSSAVLQTKAFGHHKMALESTLPPHNDNVARRVSEGIESSFHAQSEFL